MNRIWPNAFPFLLIILGGLALCGVDFLPSTGPAIEDAFRNGQARYLMIAAVPCITLCFWGANPAWALFLGWSFLRWIFADWPSYGMMDVTLIACCLLVGDSIRRMVLRDKVLQGVAWLAMIQAVYGISQYFGFDPFFDFRTTAFENTAIGTIGQFTMLGAFVGLGAIYFFNEGLLNWKNASAFAVCCAGIYVCQSTMPVLGTAAGIGYVVLRRDPKVGCILGSLMGALLTGWWLVRPTSNFFALSGRQEIWPHVLDRWTEAPLFGFGPGSWAGGLPTYGIVESAYQHWYQAHNDFLQVLPEQGLLGLVIVLAGLYFFFLAVRRLSPCYGAWGAALCVGCMGNFLLHMVCFGLIAGWLASVSHNHEEPEAPWNPRS